jgi:hypothetical protein
METLRCALKGVVMNCLSTTVGIGIRIGIDRAWGSGT